MKSQILITILLLFCRINAAPIFHESKNEPNDILIELSQLTPCLLEQAESLEQLRWLYYGYQIHLVRTTIETPNIDVPEDVQKVLPFL